MPIVRNVVNKLMLSVFIEGQMLAANPSIAPRLRESMGSKGLFPLPLPTFDQAQIQMPGMPFWAFSNSDGTRNLTIAANRVNYVFTGGVATTAGTPTWGSFVDEGIPILVDVLKTTERVGHRIAFIVEELATSDVQEPVRSRVPSDIASLLLKIPDGLGTDLQEWTWRVILRLEEDGETYNLIPEIQRVFVTAPGGSPTDALLVKFDVNSVPEVTALRFDPDRLPTDLARLVALARRLDDSVAKMTGDY